MKKADRVADAEVRLGAALRCKFCPFSTPKWKIIERRRQSGWPQLESHMRQEHFDRWRAISEKSLDHLFKAQGRAHYASVVDEFDRYLLRTASHEQSTKSEAGGACRQWQKHRRRHPAASTWVDLLRRWIGDVGLGTDRLEMLWFRFHYDVVAAERPLDARYEEGCR